MPNATVFFHVLLPAAAFGSIAGVSSLCFALRYARLLGPMLRSSEPLFFDSRQLMLRACCCKRWSFKRGLPDCEITWLAGTAIAMAGFSSVLAAGHGLTLTLWSTVAALAVLLALAIIDAKTGILPDMLTLPLLWLGLALAWAGGTVSLHDAVAGAIAGYGFLWLLFWLFKWTRKREAMGYGDFKLFAALGAWVGIAIIPYVLLAACVAAILYAVWRRKRPFLDGAYSFGPFLAAAGAAAVIFSPRVQSYIG